MLRLMNINTREMNANQLRETINNLVKERDEILSSLSKEMRKAEDELFDIYRTLDFLNSALTIHTIDEPDADELHINRQCAERARIKAQVIKSCASTIYFVGE